ncbi:hypothetical protein [Bordetella phage vB_BbrM_PHB04]|uniref:Uncharacterized protein n=1 Tax=Bordetella phage vB_BbrM_PHB04 TaxID=2029657 RepID=A0A291L9Z3_9CAUD|nr:hypothetical protein HOS14_gp084 [Bordetella phage vB_BbrM_PHB04]ATI15702.1 hypothetical protein [Bordetella phage vB_BbrM_PHB04]
MKETKITPVMRDALERVARGLSLRGYAHASTYWALRRKGLIFDSETITDAGRAAIGLSPAQPGQH